MDISPEEEERLYKEKQRLERELEIAELIRQGQAQNAALDKENLKSKYTEQIAILGTLLICAIVIIAVMAGK